MTHKKYPFYAAVPGMFLHQEKELLMLNPTVGEYRKTPINNPCTEQIVSLSGCV